MAGSRPRPPSGRARPQLRRATDFIRQNAHKDIGVGDIAAAVGVTPRAVQYMFRRYLGVTPLEYLRQLRLEGAHHDLTEADPAIVTVNEIAVRWRFYHAGRFSMAYREVFGASPSQTLRG